MVGRDEKEYVSFITIQSGDDLIVSFAIPGSDPFDIKSLMLLRTPKYEFILDDTERGVNVSYDDFPDDEDDLLEEVDIEGHTVRLTTDHRSYTLDVRDVDLKEIGEAKKILETMKLDSRFKLRTV